MEVPEASTSWWTEGAPEPVSIGEPPLDSLERLAWAGNVQLVRDPTRRFPGLLVQGDTLHELVNAGEAEGLVDSYEELMASVGQATLPYVRP
jgi:hypothetical protein